MSINYAYFDYFVNNTKTSIIDARINKILQLSKCDFFLVLSSKANIHISLNSQNPFISEESVPFTIRNETSQFLIQLKKELQNARIEELKIENEDKIISIKYRKTYDNYEIQNGIIILEFLTNHPNLIVLDKTNTILLAYRYSTLFVNRPIAKGMIYEFPPKGEKMLVKNTNTEKIIADYNSSFENLQIKDCFKDVKKIVNNKTKQLQKKIKILNELIVNSKDFDYMRRLGDYIYENIDSIEDNKLIFEDQEIELNNMYTIGQNANLFYKKYHKLKQGYTMNIEFLKVAQDEYDYFTSLNEQIAYSSLDDMSQIKQDLISNGYLKEKNEKKHAEAISPYFIMLEDVKICFGKNNLQNDMLTFKLSKPNYYFFHIKDYNGSHVVIFSSNPNENQINYAAELALFLSHKENGEVLLADVHDVKKANKLGKVNILKFETILINSYDEQKIKEKLKEAKKL
ncbi:MAG: NFACT family protein [Bacilli bacterium]